jgi:hypothetical protein
MLWPDRSLGVADRTVPDFLDCGSGRWSLSLVSALIEVRSYLPQFRPNLYPA